MVKSFQFAKLPGIHFGCGKFDKLGGFVKNYGASALLVTGRSSFMSSVYGEKLLESFRKNNISYKQIIISGEPSPSIIDGIVADLSNISINVVIAIGGGSVIDAGKAVAAMIYKTEPIAEFLEGVGKMEHPGTRISFIAVPTTSGTGSEATKNAVISQIGRNGYKRSLRHDNLVPDIALIDPLLTVQCPPDITATSGMDCFTQLVEAFLSDKSNEYSDALAIEGLKMIKTSLTDSYIDGHNIEARTGMSFAALTSGICLANAGLGIVHGFASSIGGLYNVPHGLVCGTLMAKSNEVNVRELRIYGSNPKALKKYAILGEMFVGKEYKSEEYYADGFIYYLHELTNYLNLRRLRDFGLEEKDVELICLRTEIKNNPVKLAAINLAEIVLERL
jgi:alcohol dehydrogenase class IV